jgi:hypothetical protein
MQARAGCRERARRKVSERFVTNGPSFTLLPRSAVRREVSGELYGAADIGKCRGYLIRGRRGRGVGVARRHGCRVCVMEVAAASRLRVVVRALSAR